MNDFWKRFLIDDHSDIKRLDYVIRYNSIPSVYHESVSQHSFWVTLHSVQIHNILSESVQDDSLTLKIMMKALTHDIAECVTGDVVRTFKYSSVELKKAIDASEEAMIQKYIPESVQNITRKSKTSNVSDQQYIDDVVKAADFVSLFHYMNREFNRGNREIMPFLNRMKRDMVLMSEKVNLTVPYREKLQELYLSMNRLVDLPEQDREV